MSTLHPLLVDPASRKPSRAPSAKQPEGNSLGISQSEPLRSQQQQTIGIDFGTSTTLVSVSYATPDTLPLLRPLSRKPGQSYMPSEVAFEPDGRVLIGDEAAGASPNASVARSVKRCLACTPLRCRDAGNCWSHGQGWLDVGDTRYKTDDVIRLILSRALELANLTVDPAATHVFLGCPVDAGRTEREALLISAREALQMPKLDFKDVIPESGAAAMAIMRREDVRDGLSLIVDFGGGSLDLALVNLERRSDTIENIAYGGDRHLGGDDFDSVIYGWILDRLADHIDVPVEEVQTAFAEDHAARRSARIEARKAKETLARRGQALIRLTIPATLSGTSWSGTLDTHTMRTLSQELLGRMIDAFTRIFHAAGLQLPNAQSRQGHLEKQVEELAACAKQHNIAQVLLVGGTCHLTCVSEMIEQVFGAERILRNMDTKPVEAITLGLAYGMDEMADAMRLRYTVTLRVWDRVGQMQEITLYLAFTPVYQANQSLTSDITYHKSAYIAQGCCEATLIVYDSSGKPPSATPLKQPQAGALVELTYDPRSTLLRVLHGEQEILRMFLTRYGETRFRGEQEEKAGRRTAEENATRERAFEQQKLYPQ